MIPIVIYSHTDYLDILDIQTNYLVSVPKDQKILLINKSAETLDICNHYGRIIFYDDQMPYASRLLALKPLNDEYIIFMHDMDILLSKEDSVLQSLIAIAKEKNIDRIDLQQDGDEIINIIETIDVDKKYKFCLVGQTKQDNYIYNVNPSIWKLSSLMELMGHFPNDGYRTIEHNHVQDYCTKYNVCKLYSDTCVNAGYFTCLPFFQYLHLTHHGEFMPRNNNYLDDNLKDEYNKIADQYISKGKRKFRGKMW